MNPQVAAGVDPASPAPSRAVGRAAPVPGGLVPPGAVPSSAPAGHGTVLPWSPGPSRRLARLRPDLLVRSQKPGIVPLTRLGLGDVLDGSLKMMRRNPQSTLGIGLLVAAALLIPALGALAALEAGRLVGRSDLLAVSGMLPLLTMGAAAVLLSGFVSVVVHEGALGRRVPPRSCWRAVRPRFLSLLGAAAGGVLAIGGAALAVGVPLLLLAFRVRGDGGVLLTLAAGLLVTVVTLWVVTRVAFAPVAAVLEGLGPGRALRRAWSLSRGAGTQFRLIAWWVLAGVLCALGVTMMLGGLAICYAIITSLLLVNVSLPEGIRDLLTLLAPHVATLAAASLSAPYLSGVLALSYLDRRFQTEGYDVTLVRRFQDEAQRVARR